MSDNEEFEPKPDQDYYGRIPDDITFEGLIVIMANGLRAYEEDVEAHGEEVGRLADVLDGWLEHDANTDNKFDHLVTDDRSDEFFNRVVAIVNP